MAMLHSDDKGLVLPPRVARIQVVLIPVGVTAKTAAEDKAKHTEALDEIRKNLKAAGVRVEIDTREG